MKRALHLLAFILLCHYSTAQLPAGSIAPNWTMTDLNGVSHTLYDYLDAGKVVFLDFSATWCGPCWSYHNSGALEDLYLQHGPGGTDDVMVFMIETDANTTTPCLYGLPTCQGGTWGDWVTGTPYPIIDNASQFGPYQINYYPTIYGICSDYTIYEVGQAGSAALWNFAQGCSTAPPEVTIANVSHVDCHGNNTGSITITVNGGVSPYTYEWSNGATSQNLNAIPAGSYSVTVTGANGGYTEMGPIQVNEPAILTSSLLYTEPAGCNGIGGTAAVYAQGGTPGYNYSWSNGATGSQAANLPVGVYHVTVTDGNGCTTANYDILILPPVIPAAEVATPESITCNSDEITIDGTNSSTGPNLEYNWTTNGGNIVSGNGTMTILVDEPGTYTLTVSNSINTCSSEASVTVVEDTAPPTANAGNSAVIDCDNTSATLTGSAAGGSNLEYLWTTSGGNIVSGATTLTPVVNAAGTYTLTVTNTDNGCTGNSSTSVTANTTPPNATATGGELTCTQNAIEIQGNSSTGGVTYEWSGPNGFSSGEQNPQVENAGDYHLTVSNPDNGCTATATALVTENTAPPSVSATGGTLTCDVNTVTLNGTADPAGSSYSWTGPNGMASSQQNPEVTATGSYTLTATAPNGCTSTATAIVGQNTNAPYAEAGEDDLLNCHATSLVLNGTGSSGGNQYSYNWSTQNGHIVSGQQTLTPTVNEPGMYTLTVTNNTNGCTGTDAMQVSTQPPVVVQISSQANIACHGGSTGMATVVATGGDGTYTYNWSNGGTGNAIENLSAGNYTLVVTDGENCSATTSVQITQPGELELTTFASAQSAPGEDDGTATAQATGGAGAYTYQWSNGESSAAITGLSPGIYSVTVEDINGCVETSTVTVNMYGCSVMATTGHTDVTCFGSDNGSAAIQLTNAALPVTYTWSNGGSTDTVFNLSPGNYTVTATDGEDCAVVTEIGIDQPAALVPNTTSTAVTAAGAADGTATSSPVGGTAPFSFLWSNGSTNASIYSLSSANYTVTVTDQHGCTGVQTVPVAPFACTMNAALTIHNVSCYGEQDGQATVTIGNGLSPFSYEWSNGTSTPTNSDLSPGDYTVTVTDAVGCAVTASATISSPTPLSVNLGDLTPADCNEANGSAGIIATGGTSVYSYAWSNGGIGEAVTGLEAGNYTVTVTDQNDCISTLTIEIMVDDDQAPVAVTQDITVMLDENGTAVITPGQIDNGSWDNCNIVASSLDISTFDCGSTGNQEVTLTVVDGNGNAGHATSTVTVVDNTAPFVALTDVTVYLDENGQADISHDLIDNGSTDNCGITGWQTDISSFNCGDTGANAVVLTVTDEAGNSAAGTAIVTVVDNLAPVASCPDDLVLPYCDPVGNYAVTATDNCAGGLTFLYPPDYPSGSNFPAGVTELEVYVTDESNNTSSCSFTVTVAENMDLSATATSATCFGNSDGTINLAVNGGTPGYVYEWNNGATTASIENLPAGLYSVVVTDAAGCQEMMDIEIGEPEAIDIMTDEIIPETNGDQSGAILVTVEGGTFPLQYLWTDINGNTLATGEDISGLAAGNYYLNITDANGCTTSATFTVSAVVNAREVMEEPFITIFPNPASDWLTIQLEGSQTGVSDLAIIDLTGRTLLTQRVSNPGNGHYHVELPGLPAGIYFLKLLVKDRLWTRRFMVTRP